MLLFSAVINKRRGKKLISKTIKHKLDSSSKMQFALFYPKDIQKYFLKAIDFIENLEMTQIAGGGGTGGRGTIFFTSLWRNEYENRYVIHPWEIWFRPIRIAYLVPNKATATKFKGFRYTSHTRALHIENFSIRL